MVYVFIMLVAEQLPAVLLLFPIVWLVMRKKHGQVLKISNWWLLAGFIATAFLTGALRFIFMLVEGASTLNPDGNALLFFYLGLPILVAICVCHFLKTKAS